MAGGLSYHLSHTHPTPPNPTKPTNPPTQHTPTVRAVVRAELKRQLEGYRQAGLANRAGVAEQARESKPPGAYRRPQGQPPVLGANHVAALRSEEARDGLCVLDGVIDEATLAAARAEAESMKAAGRLKATPQRAAGTRFDSVRWLDERELEGGGDGEAYPTLARLVRMMKSLASEVEEGGEGAGEGGALIPRLLVPKYCMIAVYEGEGVSLSMGRVCWYGSTKQTINQSINQPTNQPTHQLINR